MMIWIKLIKKLIKALNADVAPGELALGAALGAIIGLTPANALHNAVVIALLIVLKANIQAAFFSMLLFGIIGFIIDPLAHVIGSAFLLNENAASFWISLSVKPLYPLLRLNNTVVLGSLIISLILFIPNFLFFKWFVVFYRNNLHSKVEKLKIVKLLKATKIYRIYERFSS